MSGDESLGLAQILLGLLLFTVGIPALIIEIRVEEPLRRLLHQRTRQGPIVRLGVITLSAVGALILLTGVEVNPIAHMLLKVLVILLIALFVQAWLYIYRNVRINLVIDGLVQALLAKRDFRDPDLEDLITFGEHLRGSEKDHVIRAIGALSADIQQARDYYDGTQLEHLLRGLQRVVERGGTPAHHRSALAVVTKVWGQLVQQNLVDDHDADVLREVVRTLGSVAVSPQMGSMPLRWMSSIPYVLDVPYSIGATAVRAGAYTIAVDALSRLSWTAEAAKSLPPELIALIAHFQGAGPSAGRTARDFLDRLKYSAHDVRVAAETAAEEFRVKADYATADAIGAFLESYR